MVTVVVMTRTMTLMIAILVDISIDNHSWFIPTAVAGIDSVTERQKCRICCCVTTTVFMHVNLINPLNTELNPICHLLALLGVHFLHVSRIRVKSLTLRLLMSYI